MKYQFEIYGWKFVRNFFIGIFSRKYLIDIVCKGVMYWICLSVFDWITIVRK